MEVTGRLCSFRLVVKEKAGKRMPKLSRVEFPEKFLVNNFILSHEEENTPRLLYREGIADLSLLRKLLTMHQILIISLDILNQFSQR